MKPTLLIILLLLSLGCAHKTPRVAVPTSPEAKVWVCTGSSSKRYHARQNCYGLRNCQGEKLQTTLRQANEAGRTPCRKCYKR